MINSVRGVQFAWRGAGRSGLECLLKFVYQTVVYKISKTRRSFGLAPSK